MNKLLPIIIVIAVVVGGGSFYGGMKYQQSKNPLSNFSRQNFQGSAGAALGQGTGARGAGAGFLSGEVMTKDSQSLTLKMTDGSSKIVFFSTSTGISKTAEGTVSDIEIGKQIVVTGTQNSDGSYTAKTIQLSPRVQLPANK